ncbi:MAG TPA: hypothetical protein VGN72_03365 [Tepidisphaeraceae bacterium]|jgi:hypothetical protein|nr:hypothetical protein [Tepidisphaeraceae bacterium]
MLRPRVILAALALAALVPVAAAYLLLSLARSDVESQGRYRATLVRVRPSLNCIVWIEYTVAGDPVYTTAHWRVRPWRDVSFGK